MYVEEGNLVAFGGSRFGVVGWGVGLVWVGDGSWDGCVCATLTFSRRGDIS